MLMKLTAERRINPSMIGVQHRHEIRQSSLFDEDEMSIAI
jgi:hypothetical protein